MYFFLHSLRGYGVQEAWRSGHVVRAREGRLSAGRQALGQGLERWIWGERAHLGRPAAGHSLLSPQDPLHSAQLHGLDLGVRQRLQYIAQTEDFLPPPGTCQPMWER